MIKRHGPKRRRKSRRELPNGLISQWLSTTNMKREREKRLLALKLADEIADLGEDK